MDANLPYLPISSPFPIQAPPPHSAVQPSTVGCSAARRYTRDLADNEPSPSERFSNFQVNRGQTFSKNMLNDCHGSWADVVLGCGDGCSGSGEDFRGIHKASQLGCCVVRGEGDI